MGISDWFYARGWLKSKTVVLACWYMDNNGSHFARFCFVELSESLQCRQLNIMRLRCRLVELTSRVTQRNEILAEIKLFLVLGLQRQVRSFSGPLMILGDPHRHMGRCGYGHVGGFNAECTDSELCLEDPVLGGFSGLRACDSRPVIFGDLFML